MILALLVPAFNEADSIARTAMVMSEALAAGLVQRAVVLDGGSTDGTAEIARDHGAEVLAVHSLLPALGPVLGKGDSLFRGVHGVPADGYVFVDADLGNLAVSHVAALAEALGSSLARPASQSGDGAEVFIKGGFVRVDEHGHPRAIPAGRVSEEVARPLLGRAAPSLTGLSQPLSGQVALSAGLARRLHFATGYGIEIAMLLEVVATCGEAAVIEVQMGALNNRWKPDDALNDVRTQVLAGASLRGVTLPEFGNVSHPTVTLRDPPR